MSASGSLPLRQIAAIGVAMAVGSWLLWLVISAIDHDDVSTEPTGAATPASTPTIDPAPATPAEPVATPEVDPAWPAGSLPAMLQLAPDRLSDGSLPLAELARYADIAGWMMAAGVSTPADLSDPTLHRWEAELGVLALPQVVRDSGLTPEWGAAYGFTLIDVAQVLSVGQAPDFVTIMRGAFDQETMRAAWVASGYQPIEVEGITVWSLFPGETIDLSAPASRPAMGAFNNVVLLDDGTLVAASRTSRLADTLRAIRGGEPSLADHVDVAPLLAPGSEIDRLASAVIASGSLLAADARTAGLAFAIPAATPDLATPDGQTMPGVRLVLLGISLPSSGLPATPDPDGDVPARMVIALVVDDASAARQVREWVAWSLASRDSPVTGAAYAERYAAPRMSTWEPTDGGAVAVGIDVALTRGVADWLAAIAERDLGFARWS